jgi:hypothetical protein
VPNITEGGFGLLLGNCPRQVALGGYDIDLAVGRMAVKLFAIVCELFQGFKAVHGIDEKSSIAALEIKIEDGSILLLSGRVVISETSLLPNHEGAVNHHSDSAGIGVAAVLVSSEQFSLACTPHAQDDDLESGQQRLFLANTRFNH